MCKGCDIHRKTASVSGQLHRAYDAVLKEGVPAWAQDLLRKLD